MKGLYVTTVIAGAMFFSVASANAQVYENSTGETPVEQTQQAKYTQIDQQELPNEVHQAVEKDFKGATLAEIYSTEKEGQVIYKLVLSTADGQSQELFSDAQGNWIEKDKKELK